MPFWGVLKGKKTYITCGMTVLGAALSYLTGDITGVQAAQLVSTALMGVTLRHGMENS